MFPGIQPCFQLLRIGSSSGVNSPGGAPNSAHDLYTFRPALTHSVFRLGRLAELCDVTLESASVSRFHAELHAEKQSDAAEEESWRVQVRDRSSYGTWVNDVRIQSGVLLEIFDGDTLTFGGQTLHGSPEFYFLFQKVRVSPQDFDAITVPKASSFSSNINNRIRTSLDCKQEPGLDISKLSINKATVILNSIGSLSKINGSRWTFRRTDKSGGLTSADTPSFHTLVPPSTPPSLSAGRETAKSVPPSSKSRRKSAHTVLLEDDSVEDHNGCRSGYEEAWKAKASKRRRLYKSESEIFQSPLSSMELSVRPQLDTRPVAPKQNASAVAVNQLSGRKLGQPPFTLILKRQSENPGHNKSSILSGCRQQKRCSSAPRGRRRANSTPVCSTLLVGGENYQLATPPARPAKVARGHAARFHAATGRRRGRPRKHPPPQASLPSPASSSSSSTSSSSSSSSSSSASSSSEDEDEEENGEGRRAAQGVEPCASPCCRLPQQDTVQWVQCDDCDAWYHLDCLPNHRNRAALLLDASAEFHCGCC